MNIEFSTRFKKELKKVPFSIQKKFDERFSLFCEDYSHPLLHDHSIHPVYKNARSINVTGDYRTLYEKDENRILFTRIGTHSELYD